MPQERSNPYPHATTEEVAAVGGSRELKAARNIAVRRFGGIPVRAFLLGENDHSPILNGISDLTDSVYQLTDAIKRGAEQDVILQLAQAIEGMMEDTGLPPATGEVTA